MTAPYRTSETAMALHSTPKRWLLASITPEFLGSRWQWYRRAVGGRWCFFWYRRYTSKPWDRDGWRRVPRCPHHEGDPARHGYDGHIAECQMDCDCHCEVWS